MDILSLLRTLGALGLVLGLLASALWIVRKYDLRLPGRVSMGGRQRRRIEMVERLSIDAKRSVALIRRDDAEHLILIAPDGHIMIESGIRAPAALAPVVAMPAPEPAALAAQSADDETPAPSATNDNLADLRQGFGLLVEQARARLKAPVRA